MKDRKHLIIGCGHGLRCGNSHPKSNFITLDINPNIKPDFVCDANNIAKLKELCSSYDKLKAIIYEFTCWNVNLKLLGDLLEPNGYIIILGPETYNLVQKLDSQQIWLIPEGRVTILPVSHNQLKIDPILKSYLEGYLRTTNLEQHILPIVVTDDIKQRASRLSQLKSIIWPPRHDLPHFIRLEKFYDLTLSAIPNASPLTLNQLENYLSQYQPGFFRRNFSSGNTNGVLELKNYLNGLKDEQRASDELTLNELLKILKVIIDREDRLGDPLINHYNPTRSINGSTTKVFHKIVVCILNYFISNQTACDDLEKYYLIEQANKILPSVQNRLS